MEILSEVAYGEYEDFLLNTKNAMFLQSPAWGKIKSNFIYKVIVSRDSGGKIIGGMAVLIRPVVMGYSIMYSPRGPVCDPHNREVLTDLLNGAKALAKQYKSYVIKMDPNILKTDEKFIRNMKDNGCVFHFDGSDFSTSLQPSVVYLLEIGGRTPEQMFDHFPSKTKNSIRQSIKFGSVVKVCGKDKLPDFYKILKETCERDHFNVRPYSYFESMYDNLGEHLKLYLVYFEDTPIAGAINITYGDRSLHLYGASSNQYREKRPNDVMVWTMISYAAENGIRLYDFGGIAAVEDESNPLHGLYMFKRKFKGEVVEYVGEVEYVTMPAINKFLGFAYRTRRKLIKVKNGKRKVK